MSFSKYGWFFHNMQRAIPNLHRFLTSHGDYWRGCLNGLIHSILILFMTLSRKRKIQDSEAGLASHLKENVSIPPSSFPNEQHCEFSKLLCQGSRWEISR